MDKKSKEQMISHIEKNTKKIEKNIVRAYKGAFEKIDYKFNKLADKVGKEGLTVNNIAAIQRLRGLYQDIYDEMKKIEPNVYKWINKSAESSYKASYYNNWYNYEKQLNMPLSFGRLNAKRVKAIVNTPFPGMKLEDLVTTIKNKAFDPVKYNLAVGQALGQGPEEIARNIRSAGDIFKDQFNKATYMSLRIARTESLRAASYADIDTTEEAIDMGIRIKKQWVSTIDDRTREDHIIMDGNFSNEDGYFTLPDGVQTLAPRLSGEASQDINCRCTYIDFIEGLSDSLSDKRASEDFYIEVNGEQIPYNEASYDEWKASKRIKE
jgi:hypothetical protein